MPKATHTTHERRITFEEAKQLYPDQWVVLSDAKIAAESTSFIEGVVVWHGADQQEAYQQSASINGTGVRASSTRATSRIVR